MSKPRILDTQSAYILSKKIGAIRKALKDCCDLHFIDGPLELDKTDMPNAEMYDSMFVDSAPRAWYVLRHNHKTDNMDFKYFEKSWTFLKELLSENKYDGIFGFSQGAGFAAALAGVLANPDSKPEFKGVHPPFKFCITVGGFKVVDKAYEDIYPLPRSDEKTHFLHVTGENDMIVTPERSATLIDNSPNCRLEKHPGGHFVPSSAPWRHFFVRYISSFTEGGDQGNVVGPQPTPEAVVAKSLQGKSL
ncbi:hypothetical protein E3P98_01791 [Wallemia ichthyophaga]|nr:hypothetical protein E3P98_01791 [Wallemia ichthyophaga]